MRAEAQEYLAAHRAANDDDADEAGDDEGAQPGGSRVQEPRSTALWPGLLVQPWGAP